MGGDCFEKLEITEAIHILDPMGMDGTVEKFFFSLFLQTEDANCFIFRSWTFAFLFVLFILINFLALIVNHNQNV